MTAAEHMRSILSGGPSLELAPTPIKRWIKRLLDNDEEIPSNKMHLIRKAARNIVRYEATAPEREARRQRDIAAFIRSRTLDPEPSSVLVNTTVDDDHWLRPAHA
jgi:hypothetical protein